jgi:hypothetical protein
MSITDLWEPQIQSIDAIRQYADTQSSHVRGRAESGNEDEHKDALMAGAQALAIVARKLDEARSALADAVEACEGLSDVATVPHQIDGTEKPIYSAGTTPR